MSHCVSKAILIDCRSNIKRKTMKLLENNIGEYLLSNIFLEENFGIFDYNIPKKFY